MRWIRLDIAFDKSDWLYVLSAESQLAWVKLLCYVKCEGVAGKAKAMSPMVASRTWGIGEEAVHKLLQAAVTDGALESDGKHWCVVNWKQFQDPDNATGAERARRYRANLTKRAEVLDRDGHVCVACGDSSDLVVDHIIPVSEGGDTSIDNLQTLCRKCNASKSNRGAPSRSVTGRHGKSLAVTGVAVNVNVPVSGSGDPKTVVTTSDTSLGGVGGKQQRGTRLPKDWHPSEADLKFCRETRPDLRGDDVAEGFRDYWHSKAGAQATKLDWSATWRNWVRGQKPGGKPKNPYSDLSGLAEKLKRDLGGRN